jgi:hypothetical protein
MHPTTPLDAIVLTAMTRVGQDGVSRPYLQGQLAVQAPYFYDVLGYINVEDLPQEDPTQPPFHVRRLYVERTNQYEAGERVQGRLGSIVEQQNMSIERMIEMIYGPAIPPAPSTTSEETE